MWAAPFLSLIRVKLSELRCLRQVTQLYRLTIHQSLYNSVFKVTRTLTLTNERPRFARTSATAGRLNQSEAKKIKITRYHTYKGTIGALAYTVRTAKTLYRGICEGYRNKTQPKVSITVAEYPLEPMGVLAPGSAHA